MPAVSTLPQLFTLLNMLEASDPKKSVLKSISVMVGAVSLLLRPLSLRPCGSSSSVMRASRSAAAALAMTTACLLSSCSYATASASSTGGLPPLFHSPLVTPEQVRSLSVGKGPRLRFVDSSWHLDKKARDAKKEFLEEHIKGAVFFDIDAVSDKNTDLPHMLPSEGAFGEACSALGLLNDDCIIVYTSGKCFSAARGWWTFKCFGHKEVYVMEGGLPAWKAAGGEVESGEPVITPTRPPKGLVQDGGNAWLLSKKGYQAKLRPDMVYSATQVLRVVEEEAKSKGTQVVDARGAPRFNAQVDEPRPGLARGRIPGSRNVPFNLVLQDDWTKFRSPKELAAVFASAGVDLSKPAPIVTSCGSGVTAAVLSLGMMLASGRDVGSVPVYDGAWAEWGGRKDLPKELPDSATK